MNGFAHTILSLMLSWIRASINNVWTLLSSEDGGTLYHFLAQNWLRIVLGLCLAGVLLDLIIYFFRWRPYYVWRSRLRRLRASRNETEEAYDPSDLPQEEEPPAAPVRTQIPQYTPFAPPPVQQASYADEQPLEDPVFDDEAAIWEDAAAPLQTDWDAHAMPEFGRAKPEPASYYADMQAGYAPPVPPEKLYTPSVSYQSPVHPGLDEDAFRQSFGLQTDEEALQERNVVHAPAFRPFTVVDEDAQPAKANPFARFAQRARALVGVEDEDHQPTIHDLQSTVDVSQAFHAPVYPQPLDHYKEG